MKNNCASFKVICIFFVSSFSLVLNSKAARLSTHFIQFGAIHGATYFPNSLNVFVGDTIKWTGDFSKYPFQSVSVPFGAATFGPISLGDTFTYIVKVEGEYSYACPNFVTVGMTGNFTANTLHYGLTNEGRDFYLGMLYPSFNRVVALPAVLRDFNVFALISTYYDNKINISYYDGVGKETEPQSYLISKGGSLKIPLNYQLMQMDTASDAVVNKSCHITSKYPITVFYLSIGSCSVGSYLALPSLGLLRNYVSSNYNDNPGNGALYGNITGYTPANFEYAGGEFMVIGVEDQTNVKITPTTTTTTGHPGSNTGSPHPYTILLNKGQSHLVRSNGRSEDHDLTGSLIEGSKPIVVISGHENAFLGGADPFTAEGRDFMIEEMTPVELWDSLGYLSIPFAEAIPSGEAGHGDSYRILCFDSTSVKGHLDVQGINGGYDMSTVRLASPPEKLDITMPAEAYSLDGKKINLMQFDQRSLTQNSPWPAPSMMTIVPISRWKTTYSFMVLSNNLSSNSDKYTNATYINVISPNLSGISVSIDGGTSTPLTNLSKVAGFSGVSSHFPNLKAGQYRFSAGSNNSFHLSSDDPFMVYFYGLHDYSPDPGHLGDIKQNSALNYLGEYASPAGMQLNTGVTPSFLITADTTCFGWHVCVRDTGKTDPGLKAVILIDDPDAIYWQQPGAKFKNVGFSESAPDYYDNSELHPHVHGAESYCFDVKFTNALDAASAPLAIVDNLGNSIILKLDRSASALKLTTNPPTPRADSIVFPVKKIGDQICTTFVFKNTAPKGGTALNLNAANFTNSDASYKIQSVTPSLPHSLAPQDSLSLQVCYTPLDSARHRDSLIMKTDCFSFAISLDAHGSTGLISASDLDFATINVGDTSCKDILIKNVGSAPFTVTKSFVLSDSVNFSINSSSLPKTIAVGSTVTVNVCFHPQTEGPFSAGIDWGTDLEASFAHSIKSHSSLTGNATPKAGVKMAGTSNSFSIYPNPANGNSAIVTIPTSDKSTLSMFDVLGREVFHQNILSDIPRIEIPLRNIPEGVYYVQLNSPTGSVSQKFVRSK